MGTGWKINRIGRKPNFKGTQSKITKILRNPIKNKSISKALKQKKTKFEGTQ